MVGAVTCVRFIYKSRHVRNLLSFACMFTETRFARKCIKMPYQRWISEFAKNRTKNYAMKGSVCKRSMCSDLQEFLSRFSTTHHANQNLIVRVVQQC